MKWAWAACGVCVCFLSVSATICNCSNPEIKPERSFSLVINKPITQDNCKDSIVLISNWTTNLRIYQMFVRFLWRRVLHSLRKGRHRVLKWWRHKNEISEIMEFVRIFWKNNVQDFLGVNPKKNVEGFVCSYQSITELTSQRNAHFWQVGLLDIVLSEYPDKSHDFRNLILITSSLFYSVII